MKKFVSLCAFVAALSFVSCEGNAKAGSVDSVATDSVDVCERGACDSVNKACCATDSTKVGCCKDSLAADSTAAPACCEEPKN